MSDSNGYIYDADGIKLDVVKEIKEVRRGRIKEYADAVPTAVYTEGKGIWTIPLRYRTSMRNPERAELR